MRLLVVEDDPEVNALLTEALGHRGHVVDQAGRGLDAIWMSDDQPYDVVILDVGLPDMTGMEVCRRLRAAHPALPVLMLTGLTHVRDRVQGLDAGADDYLSKPVSLAELDARLRALSRRCQSPVVEQHTAGDVSVTPARREVCRRGRLVPLVGREYALVELLARSPGQVVTRDRLAAQLWGRDTEVSANAIDVLVAAVRRKLDAPFDEPVLRTVRGSGYRLG